MEIERKYLVHNLPDNLSAYPHSKIEQAYLCLSPVVRVRRRDDCHILTVKEKRHADGTTAIVNREEEFDLSEEAYNSLKSKAITPCLTKTRYKLPLPEGLSAELDVFHRSLEGLMMAEVEFPDIESSMKVQPPEWFGEEVSDDPRFRNTALAVEGNPLTHTIL